MSHAALYYNPIPLDGEGFFCVYVDISTGLTLSQSIFCCSLGNAAYASVVGGLEGDRGAVRGEFSLQIQGERWRDNRRDREGFPVPFLETLTGVPNNKLKPPPPPLLSPPFGGCEGRSSHCALNTHSAQINAHTLSRCCCRPRGKADVSPPAVSSVCDWTS